GASYNRPAIEVDATVNARVLIIDPNARRAASVSRTLGAEYDCIVASSVSAAFQVLPRQDWYAALADFDMDPDFNGIEMLQEVRDVDERILRVLYAAAFSTGLVREAQRKAHAHAVLDATDRRFT